MPPLSRPFQSPRISKLVAPAMVPLLRSFSEPVPFFTSYRSVSSSSDHDSAATAVTEIWSPPDQNNVLKKGYLKSGLYLVATPIGNLEDITLRALRILKSADVILSEDTRHSRKLVGYYNIDTPLLSYHKFNKCQREAAVLQRLKEGQIVALISDAGTPGISDPGAELVKLCAAVNIAIVPIPGPSALVTALSACGLPSNEFTFVGFLPKHAGLRRSRLVDSASQTATQIFFVPPHKLLQFLAEASLVFGDSRYI
ncbi:16S rRNA (cytidine1402-2'-O)-methyltransferase [Apostasia shenzhenica]|uniref:16S rRNA (Cytidine1402-2'-O)-methyltransferase n=1 Tax=Apostasia shenzhenica TaxID=1088818 RepID=A0A2I0ARX8_9ASPA|nr:16S rRNA (cytidine1402-2'-O)-methyltransferase [Apostasia shenzhenica]